MKLGATVGIGVVVVGLVAGGLVYAHQQHPTTSITKSSQHTSKQTKSATIKPYPVQVKAGSTEATTLMVVNKKHPLPADYNPYNGGLSPKTNQAKDELISAMKAAGFNVGDTVSGYRAYDYQKTLYDGYVAGQGQAAADSVSARPGYSEHQTGLAFDLRSSTGGLFAEGGSDPDAAQWLQDNAYKYGLIVRYPEDLTTSTGYDHEEWHMRYVGKRAAAVITKYHLSLEQYTGNAGGDYNKSKSADIPALEEYSATYKDRLTK
ncbi:M15 family metallopeptidase [Weissella cibaria]|uniref:M15 family metallopeptidase n=1 Tax=Weissella cibaria TaxID=137591 RepID=A0A9Q8JJ87_9LACO|nr:M15 family metallopeptidase [Weissella cibaria]QMU88971.1 M15 family metallopeptidase [Weissella cibaria]TVV28230.1 M15 family metallopeptidase [Weissella cibaria]TVV36868.1 M15 family metallopeptidase [Weissella cibaria]TVV41423.1 M15 family metallopeptidase [Weissella cibaria]UNW39172.1 M15 family metallopeptidase [Weissella cibaria]